ncbi:hypothetical protein WBV14_04095 [Acinetobacter baumannii]
MDNYKIKVKDEAASKEAQELFFELGYEWRDSKRDITNLDVVFIYAKDGVLTAGFNDHYFAEAGHKELTLPQLRDLVVVKSKTVREFLEPQEDGTYKYVEWTCMTCPPEDYIEIPEGTEVIRRNCEGSLNFYAKINGRWAIKNKVDMENWYQPQPYSSHFDADDGSLPVIWKRPAQDPALISGADAMIAAIDGKDVEYEWIEGSGNWRSFNDEEWSAEDLKSGGYRFRIKPTTLKVNAELPKPSREFQQNTEVYAVTYEFKTREERNAFADKLRGTNS